MIGKRLGYIRTRENKLTAHKGKSIGVRDACAPMLLRFLQRQFDSGFHQ